MSARSDSGVLYWQEIMKGMEGLSENTGSGGTKVLTGAVSSGNFAAAYGIIKSANAQSDDARRGYAMNLDLIILAVIADKPHYGYEIKKYLEQYYDSITIVNTNTIYPILRKFVELGYVEKSVVAEPGKPNKNMYEITAEGRRRIVKELRSFPDSIFHDRDACMLRLMYFDWLDREARVRLLDGREKCILESMEQIKKPHNFHKAHPIISQLGRENQYAELRAIALFRENIDSECLMDAEGNMASSGK